MSNNDWISGKAAQDRLGRSERQIRNYANAGKIRTQVRGRRVEYYSPDVDALVAELRPDDRPRAPETQIIPAGELLNHIRQLEAQLSETMLQVGYLRSALEERTLQRDEAKIAQRMLVDKEREAAELAQELTQVRGTSTRRGWLNIALVVLLIVVIAGAVYLLLR